MNRAIATPVLADSLLQRFCAPESESREYLKLPWRLGDFIYATNGHMLVRIADDGRAAAEFGKHPKAHELLEKHTPGHFIDIPPLADPIPCERCNGNGTHEEIECPECNGTGDFDHKNYTYDCKRCDGMRTIGERGKPTPCDLCEGFGEVVRRGAARTPVGDTGYATRYLRFLSQLPGIQIAPNGMNPCPFRFDGGCGLLMPMVVR